MKFTAAILLIVFSSFTVEQALMPSNCVKVVSSCKMKCMKQGCMSNMPGHAGKQKEATPKCEDCPLCVTMEFPSIYSAEIEHIILKDKYGIIDINPLSSFSSSPWKPPNA